MTDTKPTTGLCAKCRRDKCRVRMDGLKSCDMHLGETNYERLFGTPERAARTMADTHVCSIGSDIECNGCASDPICESGTLGDYGALLEWLGEEAES